MRRTEVTMTRVQRRPRHRYRGDHDTGTETMTRVQSRPWHGYRGASDESRPPPPPSVRTISEHYPSFKEMSSPSSRQFCSGALLAKKQNKQKTTLLLRMLLPLDPLIGGFDQNNKSQFYSLCATRLLFWRLHGGCFWSTSAHCGSGPREEYSLWNHFR